ncbi:MAG: PBECR2 nuclease fold domain-containing protein, partial [Helicobacter sp.]|uniref:putative barnase/colicin E5 family endoribonuclease n=1 Tax=Helicobacter sp. TaxID=218 RepID=UPI002A7C9807|nr:PBECR2 nuclease fold domain-containing protein [Helicobacter sp.]
MPADKPPFIDAKGKEREITKQVQEQWLETFNLKSLDEDFIPNLSGEVKEALAKNGFEGEIHLKRGSLEKLAQRDRSEFLEKIRPTLETPEAVVKQNDGAFIFIKDFNQKKYFASVTRNENGEWIVTSNAPKTLNNIKNKINEGGELLFSKLPELPIIAKPELPAKALNSEATKDILPQESKTFENLQTLAKKYPKAKEVLERIEAKKTLSEVEITDKEISDFRKRIAKNLKQLQGGTIRDIANSGTYNGYRIMNDADREAIKYMDYDKDLMDKYYAIRSDKHKRQETTQLIKEILSLKKEKDKAYKQYYDFKNTQKQQIQQQEFNEWAKQHKDNYKKRINTMSKQELEQELDSIEYHFAGQTHPIDNYKQDIILFKQDRIPYELWDEFYSDSAQHYKFKNFKEKSLKQYIYEKDKLDNQPYAAAYRQDLEQELNIQPIKEFGTNYAEFYHDGLGAIQKLLTERQGQVSGAFYRQELGDIDLVWGDSNFGLKHILDKHGSEFKDIAKELDEIIQNGEVVKRQGRDEAYNIEYKGFKVGINKGFNKQGENKWVVTAFNDNIEKTAKTAPANDSTKGASLPLNSKEDSTTKNTNPTQNTPMKHTKEAIKQYLQGFSKHLSNQSKQQIPSVLKEIDSFTNANDIVQYTGAFKKEIQQFIPYLETKEKLEQVLQTPKLQRDPKENLEVSITRIDEKPSKIHLAFDEKGYIPYDTHIAEEFLKQPTTNKDTSTLIDTFIKGAYKKAQKDLSDTYLLDFTGSKIDFGEDITLLNGRELYYKDKQINNEYASPSVLINTAKKLKEGLSDSDLYLAHANKDNLANYHYPYNLLNEYLEDISLLSDWGLADLLVDKSIKQPFNQALDKAFKANGEPFGVLWNNEATKKNLEQNLADYGISINPKDFFVGKNAIDFLLDKQSGYIQSAFHKEGLGDIDLVWGEVKGSGKDAKGFGLSKILEKHIDDFKDFVGDTKEAKLVNGINEIIENGKVVKDSNGRTTIVYNDYFKIGLKQNWKGETTPNNWVITAYEDTQQKERDKIIHSDSFTKGETLPLNSKEDSTTKNTTSQTKAQDIQKALELLTDEANKKDFIDKYYKPRFKHEPTD